MARIQIITAVTLDGYLPDPNEELLQWVKTDSQGFPFWHERSTFTLFPGYPMLDLICEKDEKPDSFTFTSEISDPKSLDLLHGLSIYHLIDEIIIYILPLTTGNERYGLPASTSGQSLETLQDSCFQKRDCPSHLSQILAIVHCILQGNLAICKIRHLFIFTASDFYFTDIQCYISSSWCLSVSLVRCWPYNMI